MDFMDNQGKGIEKEQRNEQEQVRSEIMELSQKQGNKIPLTLFKIFGEAQFSFQSAYSSSKTDWSGFYTQYSPIHSMRYLTKKWSDGSNFACLLQLHLNPSHPFPLKLIKVSHSCLGKHSIEGQYKAKIIKQHLLQKYGINFGQNNQDLLLRRLGEEGILLQCVDCEDQEVIIPHSLLNGLYFLYQGIAVFQKSCDGFMRTIRWRKYYDHVEENWKPIKGQQQFEPYLLINTCAELNDLLKQ